jgi:hypothetical protein
MDNEIIDTNLCSKCRFYLGDLICLAFDRIPNEILEGKNDHRKPLPDQDNDIVFEEKADAGQ